MGAFIRNVDRIRSATKAHVLTVHHTGKDEARGSRGHSSLPAAVDTEIKVADKKIITTKQRDMDKAAPIGFDVKTVEVGRDGSGRPVTSLVVPQLVSCRRFHRQIDRAGQPRSQGAAGAQKGNRG